MRPIILVSMNVAPVGGLTADVLKCVRALRKQGREVHVIYGFRGEGTLESVDDPNVNWHKVFLIKRPPVLSQLMLWLFSKRKIKKIVANSDNPLVVCFDRLPLGDAVIGAAPVELWRKARKQLKLPLFFYQPAYQNWCKWIDSILATSFSGKIVVYSKRDRDAWLSRGVPASKVVSLAIPTSTERFNLPTAPNDKRPYILIIGRSMKHKGIDLTLKAWPEIYRRHPDLKLKIVTQGWKVRRIAEQFRLKNVVVEDFIQNVEDLYHESRLVIMPSMYETWGNVVPEALACGVPVVASSEVPSSEMIDSEQLGVVFMRNGVSDDQRLVEAVDSVLNLSMESSIMESRHNRVESYMNEKKDIVSWLCNQNL